VSISDRLAELVESVNQKVHAVGNEAWAVALELERARRRVELLEKTLAEVVPYAEMWMAPHGEGCGDGSCPLCKLALVWGRAVANARQLLNR